LGRGLAMLQVDAISAFYGKIQALKSVSLTVNPGEIVTLIGANGAGKTTTLMAISGIVRPASGKITWNGRDLSSTSAEAVVQAGIAHVPEGRRIFPQMTVLENLRMGAYSRKDRNNTGDDIARAFDLFPRLKERRTQFGGTLSGGEQQMLAIGRALMARPKLLLLDEPSLGLAPIVVDRVFEVIKEINQQGMAVLLVEQNAFAALQLAHRGYVLETGRTSLEGTGAHLLEDEQVRQAYLG
jgi:branched-chain amino acid transport system ATP-binding protein